MEVDETESSMMGMKGKELFLDTKGACFLCLRNFSNSDISDGDNEGELMEVSLRNICRYLRIDPYDILTRSLKGSLLDEEESDNSSVVQRDKCDFSVMLCANCSSLTERLSELIRDEEMTKMLINYKLQRFNQILVESEEEPEPLCRWKKLEERMMSGSFTPVETGLVKELRHETKTKSSTKLKKLREARQPKVLLNRFQEKYVKEESNSTTTRLSVDDYDAEVPWPEQEKKITSDVPMASRSTSTSSARLNPIIGESQPMVWLNPSKLRDREEDSTQITTTPVKSLNPGGTETSSNCIGTHNLASNNLENFTSNGYTNGRQWLLEMLTIHCKKAFGNQFKCTFCNKMSAKASMYYHFAVHHADKAFASSRLPTSSDTMFKKLCTQILDTERRELNPTSSVQSSEKFSCSVCNRNFAKENAFKYHFAMDHFKIFEEKLLLLQSALIRTPLLNEDSTNDPLTSKEATHALPKNGIHELNQMGEVSSSMLAQPGINTSAASSSILMESATSHKHVCEMRESILGICKTYIKRKPDRHYYCSICNKNFSPNSQRRKEHLVCCHPEVFFAQMKPQNQSEKIFKANCQRMLHAETNQARQVLTVSSGSLPTKKQDAFICTNCNRKYTNVQLFKCHTVMEHYQFLQEKLMPFTLNGTDLNPHPHDNQNAASNNCIDFNRLVEQPLWNNNGFEADSFDPTVSDEPMMHVISGSHGSRVMNDPLEGDVFTYPRGTDATTIEEEDMIDYDADSLKQWEIQDDNEMDMETASMSNSNSGESRDMKFKEEYLDDGEEVACEDNENVFVNSKGKIEPLDIVSAEMES